MPTAPLICLCDGLLGFLISSKSAVFASSFLDLEGLFAKDVRLHPSISSHYLINFYPSMVFSHVFTIFIIPPNFIHAQNGFFNQMSSSTFFLSAQMKKTWGALWARLTEIKLFSSFSPEGGHESSMSQQAKPLSIWGFHPPIIKCRNQHQDLLENWMFLSKMCQTLFREEKNTAVHSPGHFGCSNWQTSSQSRPLQWFIYSGSYSRKWGYAVRHSKLMRVLPTIFANSLPEKCTHPCISAKVSHYINRIQTWKTILGGQQANLPPFTSKIRLPRRPLFSTCANELDGLDPPSKLPFWAASLRGWGSCWFKPAYMAFKNSVYMSWKHWQKQPNTNSDWKKEKDEKKGQRAGDFTNSRFPSACCGSNFSCLPRTSTPAERGLPVRCRSSGNLVVSWKRKKMPGIGG